MWSQMKMQKKVNNKILMLKSQLEPKSFDALNDTEKQNYHLTFYFKITCKHIFL